MRYCESVVENLKKIMYMIILSNPDVIHFVSTAFIDECSGYGMGNVCVTILYLAVGTEWVTPRLPRIV